HRSLNPPISHISTLSLHDALPICLPWAWDRRTQRNDDRDRSGKHDDGAPGTENRTCRRSLLDVAVTAHRPVPKCENITSQLALRSEEHTSELQSHLNLVCRLLLDK